jgi:mono/diheme cytochrome c family protein
MSCARAALVAAALLALASPVLAQDAAAIEKGKQVYDSWCVTCHGPGRTYPGTVALQAKYKGALPPELANRTDLTEAAIRTVVRRGISIMPFFRKTEVGDADLAALVAYLRRPRAPAAAAPAAAPGR